MHIASSETLEKERKEIIIRLFLETCIRRTKLWIKY